jgi:hypothetical protein
MMMEYSSSTTDYYFYTCFEMAFIIFFAGHSKWIFHHVYPRRRVDIIFILSIFFFLNY